MVTIDGQSIAGGPDVHASVCFSPIQGGAPSIGAIDGTGRYVLSTGGAAGIRPGKYAVAVSATKIIPPRVAGDAPGGQLITPRKYANAKESGLQVDIHPGSNQCDLALTSQIGS